MVSRLKIHIDLVMLNCHYNYRSRMLEESLCKPGRGRLLIVHYFHQLCLIYRPAFILGGPSTIELLTSGLSDYDNLHGGWYFCGAGYSADDRPEKTSGFVLNKKQGASSGLQVYFPMNNRAFYTRTHSGETWSVWLKYTGVAI